MGYTAKAPANYFLGKYNRFGISPLKLQKLVYISHGWHMALSSGDLLVDDEFAEAWQFGPVFPSLYHEFKDFGSGSINRKAQDLRFMGGGADFDIFIPEIPMSDERSINLLDRIWTVYGKFAATQLSFLTHAKGTPWHQVWSAHPGMRNMHIPNELIRKHYEEKAA